MTISQQMILLFNQTGPNEYAHSLQEVTFENEAIERWFDDGGTGARRWQVHA